MFSIAAEFEDNQFLEDQPPLPPVRWNHDIPTESESKSKIWQYLSLAGAATGAYHGFRRNNSVGWAIGWAFLGGAFPVITIPVSLAQGYGKPRK